MSLTGNLEDLPLLDILQIVSFSKKTGWLSIRTSAGDGAIVFDDGFVVASFTWITPPVDPRMRTLTQEKRERLLRGRIEMALEQLIRLREGEFSFSLTDTPPKEIAGRVIVEETLDGGINPQELLLELARGMDEDRRDSAAALEVSFAEAPEAPAEAVAAPAEEFEEEFEEPPAVDEGPAEEPPLPVAATSPAGEGAGSGDGRAILLVDDEAEVRRVLAQHFTRAGHQVVEAPDPEAAVKKAHRLGKAGIPFVLVCDLGMPTSGGSSFHGGFEVIKRLGKMHLRAPAILMTDRLSGSLQARAKQLGVARVVFKPGLSKLDPPQFEADLRAFAVKMLEELIPAVLAQPAASPAARPGRPAPASPAVPTADELSRELQALQHRLRALRTPGDASHIARLVMDAAREFFERGVLFVVKNEEARGIAGFGAAPRDESLHLLVRDLAIPLGEPSLFRQVVEGGRPFRGALPEGRWTQVLIGRIGRFQAGEVALLPLVTNRESIALLYGDNPETGRPPGRLESLEVFVNQAGIALENVFLQRKIVALQGGELG